MMLHECNIYKSTALARKHQETQLKLQRWERSLSVAQNAAAFLRTQLQVDQVFCFGSILDRNSFTLTSDIDLAVQNLDPEQFFTTVAQLQDLDPEFKIDLVDLDRCPLSLKNLILTDGKEL